MRASRTTGYGTPPASTVSYCYDSNGDQTAVIAPDGNSTGVAPCNTNPRYPWTVDPGAYPEQAANETTSTFDSAGELVSTTSPATAAAPSGATTSYSYNPSGQLTDSTDPNGITTTFSYNSAGRQTGVSDSGSSAHSVSYTYDAGGQITGMTDGTGTSSYVYDPFGELTSVTNGAGRTVGYGYDADGNTTSITYPLPGTATWATSNSVNYGYDHAGQLTSVTDFNGHQITTGYTPGGLPSSQALGSTGDTISTTYDPNGNPSVVNVKNATATLLGFSYAYAYAPSGDILSETDTPSSAQTPAAYTYDPLGRVTSMTPGSGGIQVPGGRGLLLTPDLDRGTSLPGIPAPRSRRRDSGWSTSSASRCH